MRDFMKKIYKETKNNVKEELNQKNSEGQPLNQQQQNVNNKN